MKEKNNSKWLNWVLVVVALAVCFAVGYFAGPYIFGDSDEADLPDILFEIAIVLVSLYVAMTLQVIIHEAGHLVFGLMSGYRFSSFRIFSFMWMRESDGKIHLRRFSLAGTSGQCLMAPPDIKDEKIPVVLYNLGGSLLNFIVSAALVPLLIAFYSVPYLGTFISVMVLMGVVLGLINWLPIKTSTVNTDGYNAVMLRGNKEAMQAFWAQMKVNELQSLGVRISEMPEELFRVPSDEAMENSMIAAVGVFSCNRLMDEKRFIEADNLMAHLLSIKSGIAGIHRALMLCDRAYIELIGECRADVVDSYLTKEVRTVMQAMSSFPSVIRTEYVYALLVEKNADRAEKCRLRLEKIAPRYPYPNDIEAERELMDEAAKRASNS